MLTEITDYHGGTETEGIDYDGVELRNLRASAVIRLLRHLIGYTTHVSRRRFLETRR